MSFTKRVNYIENLYNRILDIDKKEVKIVTLNNINKIKSFIINTESTFNKVVNEIINFRNNNKECIFNFELIKDNDMFVVNIIESKSTPTKPSHHLSNCEKRLYNRNDDTKLSDIIDIDLLLKITSKVESLRNILTMINTKENEIDELNKSALELSSFLSQYIPESINDIIYHIKSSNE